MGYTTLFTGSFELNRNLDDQTKRLLDGLNKTRRMGRDISKLAKLKGISLSDAIEKWGPNGEFYVDFDNKTDESVINQNRPPKGQPNQWCLWSYNEDDCSIQCDDGTNFYDYVEWIRYLIKQIFAPKGYSLNGTVEWIGEDPDDRGRIIIKDNHVKVQVVAISWVDVPNDSS